MTQDDFVTRWKTLEDTLAERFGKTPNMEAILFLIGVQELQKFKKKYSKEQKQDLMHVAVCTLLSQGGYYNFEGLDKEGWPHFKEISPVPKMGLQEQEQFLKEYVLAYFDL
ncbi:hypothetical protein COR50_06580 [Chitinophaga caeni]|uniref:Uncharacterized protein n=1 Tax=Chitinophaga caeni TaxID=2029983 RepID=A0A291QSL1_9BACT|nr:hypothetical protein [Chitinophaga caeni]ATL46872.1 hypothetical protein COR50_06580 [Chitinophaga caeni]